MSALSRLKASPGLLVRALVALGAVAAIAAGLAAFASRRVPLGAAVAEEIAVLVVVGALTRRYGIALPGNGFSSYILGVTAYACSVGLALACLALAHASIDMNGFLVIGVVLVSAAVASVSVIRRGVHADELALIQGLSQAIARDISLAKSFPRIQELARRLVPWEHMGFARYDAGTNEMELVADTATGHRGPDKVRFDAN